MKTAFLDSGVGGLSVLQEAMRMMPDEDFIFYADCDNAPYGEKSPEEIKYYVNQAVDFLLAKKVGAIVMACNTATSVAAEEIRARVDIPVIGMEPAAKLALEMDGTKRVLVAATPVTTRGKKLQELIGRVDDHHLVDLLPLPRLVRLAEEGNFSEKAVMPYLEQELKPFDMKAYSAVVLGCTHFNYFKDSFRDILPQNVKLLDGNEGTVRQLMRQLGREDMLPGFGCGSTSYYFSGRPANGRELTRIFGLLERLERMREIH